jgi:hypothetical protein
MRPFKASIEEAFITVEAALATAEIVAQCEITESQAFNQMMILLLDASAILSEVLAIEAVEMKIFPTVESAKLAVAKSPKVEGLGFEFIRDGAGRCAVGLLVANENDQS